MSNLSDLFKNTNETSITGPIDTSSTLSNRDGGVLERQEYLMGVVENNLALRIEKTTVQAVEEDSYQTFAITLTDINSNSVPSSKINITGISAIMALSTDGSVFSAVGITQPIFIKDIGRVYCNYRFLAAEWTEGNIYKLTLSGIKATPDTTELSVQTIIWNSLISSISDIDTEVDAILVVVDNIHNTDLPAVKSETALIVSDTNEIQTDWHDGGRLDLIHDSILADTNEIQSDLTNGGRLDLIFDLIKLKTDNLPSDPADASNIATEFGVTNGKVDDVKTETALIKTDTTNILADTNEMELDLKNGGRLDLIFDNILIDTNEMELDLKDGGRLDLILDAINTKTTNLPSDPADASDIASAFNITNGKVDAVKSETALIKIETDKIPATITKIDAIKTKTDLIGLITDEEINNTIFGKLYEIIKHFHSVQYCYPTLANGIQAVASASIWTLGSYVVVIPTNTIGNPFDIHHIHIGNFSDNTVYEIHLFSGADGAESFICAARFARNSNTNQGSNLSVITPIIPANTQIKAKLASSSNGADTANFSVMYHTY
jgi:hypothetical protein